MANVKMEELVRVQTVGPEGIGVFPPIPVEEVSKVSETGLEMAQVQRSANVLPHPGAVENGAVMQEKDDTWDGGSSSEIITPTETTMELKPCPSTYVFGEVEELDITVTDDAQYHFRFTCPSDAATDLTLTGITGTTGVALDELEAGATYEVDIWAGVAIIVDMDITPVEDTDITP